MPIATETLALFTHLFFVPAGTAFTVPGAGTASATSKPGAADASWSSLGDVEEYTETPAAETYEKLAGRPGTVVLVDEIELSKRKSIKFKTQDRTPLSVQLAHGTLGLNSASNQGNPLEGSLLVKGWLKVQKYSGSTLKETADYWVSMRVSSADPDSGKNVQQIEVEAKVLHSTLNTVTFS